MSEAGQRVVEAGQRAVLRLRREQERLDIELEWLASTVKLTPVTSDDLKAANIFAKF